MPFGRLIKKLIRFLSPKEHVVTDKKSGHWEPLTLKKVEVARAAQVMAPVEKVPEKNRVGATSRSMTERLAGAYLYFKSNRKASALLIAGVITLLFYKYVLPIYVVLIFIAIASVSKILQDWIPFVVGFDLVLFVTVLSGAAYDWRAALIVGPVSSLIGSSLRRVTSQQFDTLIFPAIGYGLIAAMIPYLPATNIFWLGIVCTLVYVVIMNIVFAYFRPDLFNHITFTVTSLLFNYWLFKNFAEPVFSLIS